MTFHLFSVSILLMSIVSSFGLAGEVQDSSLHSMELKINGGSNHKKPRPVVDSSSEETDREEMDLKRKALEEELDDELKQTQLQFQQDVNRLNQEKSALQLKGLLEDLKRKEKIEELENEKRKTVVKEAMDKLERLTDSNLRAQEWDKLVRARWPEWNDKTVEELRKLKQARVDQISSGTSNSDNSSEIEETGAEIRFLNEIIASKGKEASKAEAATSPSSSLGGNSFGTGLRGRGTCRNGVCYP